MRPCSPPHVGRSRVAATITNLLLRACRVTLDLLWPYGSKLCLDDDTLFLILLPAVELDPFVFIVLYLDGF